MGKIIFAILFFLMAGLAHAETTQPIHVIRFDDYQTGSAKDWLLGKGFQFEQDAKRRDYIDLEAGDGRLVIEAKRPALGILANETVDVSTFSRVEIDWGVDTFPEGASYEQGIRNEAIMVVFFLGDERQPSGALFIPDCPYFVALFLCHGDDRVNHPYVGSYFKKSGRYVCGERPANGQMVTTRFDLMAAYRSYFDKEGDDDPAISGIALALDTKKAAGGGRTSAFIHEIRIY